MMYRQGDVLIEKINLHAPLPLIMGTYFKPTMQDNIVLAYGEVTGHAHRIVSPGAVLFVADRPTTSGNVVSWFNLKEDANLTHEEHAPVALKKGAYRVTRQREYDPRQDRMVAD